MTEEKTGDVRIRIVDVATELFGRQGFARTSTNQIAALARTSKRAIYATFSDKHAILEAVLDRFIARRFEAIQQLSRNSVHAVGALETILRGLLEASTDDVTMAMYRVLIAELEHLPNLSERADKLGFEQALMLLCEPLSRLGIHDHETAAKILYDVFVLSPLHRRMIGAKDQHIPVKAVITGIVSGFADRADRVV